MDKQILISIVIFLGFVLYLDLNPNYEVSKIIKGNKYPFYITRGLIILSLIFICTKAYNFIFNFNFQEIYPEPDPTSYKAVLEVTTANIFLLFMMLLSAIWILLLAVQISIKIIRFVIKCVVNDMKKQFGIKNKLEVKNNSKKYLVLGELKYFAIILLVALLGVCVVVAVTKGYFEVKSKADLYNFLVENSTITDSDSYSYDQFKITVSYLIKDLSFYTSFFSILTISIILPLVSKIILFNKGEGKSS